MTKSAFPSRATAKGSLPLYTISADFPVCFSTSGNRARRTSSGTFTNAKRTRGAGDADEVGLGETTSVSPTNNAMITIPIGRIVTRPFGRSGSLRPDNLHDQLSPANARVGPQAILQVRAKGATPRRI